MNNFWANKSVFITGINGFIGGHLANELLRQGAKVCGLVRTPRPHSYLTIEKLAQHCCLFEGDLLDVALLERIISEEQVEVVFHLAAQVEVGVGMINPFLTFETNVRGTYNLMSAIHHFPEKIKSVVVASTDKSYGSYPQDQMPYLETYPLKPQFPYDTSKACADLIAQSFANPAFKHPIVVTRFCNIYGPGQLNFSAIVPDASRAALGLGEFIPRGDGSQQRDFLYVEDVSRLYLILAKDLAQDPEKFRGQIFNAGTGVPTSVRDIVTKIFQMNSQENALAIIIDEMKGKVTRGEIDCQFMGHEKVKQFTGWVPKVELSSGLKKTLDWYRKFFELTRVY